MNPHKYDQSEKRSHCLSTTWTVTAMCAAFVLLFVGSLIFLSGNANASDSPLATQNASSVSGGNANGSQEAVSTLTLYDRQPQDNAVFSVSNMFPGDRVTNRYRVLVSYKNTVTVHFGINVRSGYEKLAEVLKVNVKQLDTGETVYDGLMRDMPACVTYKASSPDNATAELLYEITAYLDTSVGNEYQNKALAADFNWWVEETENLGKNIPRTGDDADIAPWMAAIAISVSVLMILSVLRRKEEGKKDG